METGYRSGLSRAMVLELEDMPAWASLSKSSMGTGYLFRPTVSPDCEDLFGLPGREEEHQLRCLDDLDVL